MIIVAVLVGISFLCLFLALYNHSQKEEIEVSKRIYDYRSSSRGKSSSKGDFWEKLKSSKLSDWLKIINERTGKYFSKQSYFGDMCERAGISISGSEFLLLLLGSSFLWFVLIAFLTMSIWKALALAMLWFSMWFVYIKHLGAQRMQKFSDQMADTIVMLNNSLRAGFTFQQAMDNVAKEMPDPISGEFIRALQEVQLGVPLEEALEGISRRMNNDDFDLLSTAVVIQRQVGGNLSQILDTIGNTIRDRIKLKREIKVLTSEGVFAGWAVALMPIIVVVFILSMNPHYFDGFLAISWSKYLIVGCLISEVIGGLVIRRIIDLRV